MAAPLNGGGNVGDTVTLRDFFDQKFKEVNGRLRELEKARAAMHVENKELIGGMESRISRLERALWVGVGAVAVLAGLYGHVFRDLVHLFN
jgi:hypothetical protein